MMKQYKDFQPEKCVINISKLWSSLVECKPILAYSLISHRSGTFARDSRKKVEDSFWDLTADVGMFQEKLENVFSQSWIVSRGFKYA